MHGAGLIIDKLVFASGTMLYPAPISDDCYAIVVNNLGPNTTSYRLCFQLSV